MIVQEQGKKIDFVLLFFFSFRQLIRGKKKGGGDKLLSYIRLKDYKYVFHLIFFLDKMEEGYNYHTVFLELISIYFI